MILSDAGIKAAINGGELEIDPLHAGWNGRIALEMVNLGPFHLKLAPSKTRICQLIIERLESDPDRDIATGFQGQTKPSGAQ